MSLPMLFYSIMGGPGTLGTFLGLVSFIMPIMIYIAIIVASFLLYRKTREAAWLIPGFWFLAMVLMWFIPTVGWMIEKAIFSVVGRVYFITQLLGLALFVSLPIMFIVGFLLALGGGGRISKFCIAFSILFTVIVMSVSMAAMNVYPPDVSHGGAVTASGFTKIKPQLASIRVYRDGEFTGIFTNGVGTSIVLKSVDVEDWVSGFPCMSSMGEKEVAAATISK
jgi:hypothetical protein